MISILQRYRRQIETLQKELAEIKERHHLFTEMCPDGVVTTYNGRFISINKSGLKLYGFKNEKEILGRKVLDYIHPEYRDIVRERIKRLSQGKPAPLIEEKLIRADGTVIDIEVIATPFLRNGKWLIEVIVRDITDRKKAYKLLEEKNIVLRELLEHIRKEKNSVPIENLSPKEVKICSMIRQSIANKEIARLLKVSPLSVGTYRNRIRKKLGLGRKVNLAVYLQKNHS
jgi:PAS domain S-box-containing protein